MEELQQLSAGATPVAQSPVQPVQSVPPGCAATPVAPRIPQLNLAAALETMREIDAQDDAIAARDCEQAEEARQEARMQAARAAQDQTGQ